MRHGLALLLVFAPAFAAAQSSDPAYVDSPQSKALPDPARADGRAGGSPESRQYAEDAALARRDAERIAEAQRQIQEQFERISAQQAASPPPQNAAPGAAVQAELPPVGGRSLWREARAQMGAGALQDTGGLLDAGIGRAAGSTQRVTLPDPAAAPTADPVGGP
jgi:hypothetical protein